MKSEEIKKLFEKFELATSELEGVECWSARDLQLLLGYSKWENFERVVQKAKDACKNAGEIIDNHFPDVRKMLTKRGIIPENLSTTEDVKKLQQKLDGDEKKLLKNNRKKKD